MFKIENIPVVKEVITEEQFYADMQNRRYVRHYQTLMDRSVDRKLDGYTEKHHIIPICLGGKKSGKIAVLTASEHYVAHQLLVKLFPKHNGLVYAANMMSIDKYGGRLHNKRYSWLRKRFNEVCKNKSVETRAKMSASAKVKIFSDTHRKNMSIARKGKPLSKEHKDKIRYSLQNAPPEIKAKLAAPGKASKGRKVTEETRRKISIAHKGVKRPPFTEETRRKMSIAFTGRTISDKHKNAVANANRNRVFTDEMRKKLSESQKLRHSKKRNFNNGVSDEKLC